MEEARPVIRIVSAATASHKWYLEKLLFTVKKFRYQHVVYDLGGLGYGENAEEIYKVKFSEMSIRKLLTYKPRIIRHALKKFNDHTVWIDADAFLCRNIDEIRTADYDIGVPVHLTHPELNSGVFIARATSKAEQFLNSWIQGIPNKGKLHREGDQAYLQKEVSRYYPHFRKFLDKPLNHDGVALQFVKSEIYNNTSPLLKIKREGSFVKNYVLDKDVKIIHIAFNKPSKESRYSGLEKLGLFS